MERGRLSIISGRSNIKLARDVAEAAGVLLDHCLIRRFADGEIYVEIGDNVRGADAFIMQSTSTPGNDHLMEMLIMIDALKRASAERITAVLPYFGYARQDRKARSRVAISAKLVADLITAAGAHRVLTMDLHSGQIMGFFNLPVDNLYAMPVLMQYLGKRYQGQDLCVVSPDSGGVPRARSFAKGLEASLAIIDKRRVAANVVEEMKVVGDVKGKVTIIVDDIIDTGNTLIGAAEALLAEGAKKVVACASHAVLSGDAKERIAASKLDEVILSDTIFQPELLEQKKPFVVLSVAKLIGDAISCIHCDDSVSGLFEY